MTEKRCPQIGDRVKITWCTTHGGKTGTVVWQNARVCKRRTQWQVLWGIHLDYLGKMVGFQRGHFCIIGGAK